VSVSTHSNASNANPNLAVPTQPIWRFNVTQYHQMIDIGILTADDPVEMLEGWIIEKMPKNLPHRIANKLTCNALENILPDGWYVDTQEPITLEDSEPEPDVVIVRGNTRDYSDRHPGSQDLALVVEIADSTLERDRTIKKRIYARAGIEVYWIINLFEEQIEVYTQPINSTEEATYSQRRDYKLGDEVTVFIEGREVGLLNIQDLLP
jgi:Uma2 family endonuclease